MNTVCGANIDAAIRSLRCSLIYQYPRKLGPIVLGANDDKFFEIEGYGWYKIVISYIIRPSETGGETIYQALIYHHHSVKEHDYFMRCGELPPTTIDKLTGCFQPLREELHNHED